MSSTKSSSWSHSTVCVNGHKLTVVDFGYDRFLIGAQVAQILARETFNMYRSMKIKRINIRRANPAEVAYLVRAEAVRIGTHSITLIPEALGLYFIADATVGSPKQCSNCECCAIRELSALKTKSFLVTKPKLHRRKALPWNIHRSLRKEDIERIHSDGFVRASSIATSPSASPLRSSNSSLISRSSSPFDEEVSLSRSSSPISDSSIASASSSSSLFEALTSYAGSPGAQDLTITFETSSTTSDKEVDTMQQEQQEQQEQEQDSTQFERPIPPPLSPLSPSHSSSSASDSDSLPEASPERVAPRKSPLLLPTFDRPLYCGFPIGGPVSSTPAASSFLMYSASY